MKVRFACAMAWHWDVAGIATGLRYHVKFFVSFRRHPDERFKMSLSKIPFWEFLSLAVRHERNKLEPIRFT